MVTETKSITLPDNFNPDGWKIMAAATNPIESKPEPKPESNPETLSETLERIRAEKLAAIKLQQDALAAEILAINKNAVSDVVRVLAVDRLNDQSKFKLPADLDLESDFDLTLQFSAATGKFTLAFNADVKMPTIKTVTESSGADTALDILQPGVFDDIADSANASPALKQGVRLTIMGLEQWLDPGSAAGKRCKQK